MPTISACPVKQWFTGPERFCRQASFMRRGERFYPKGYEDRDKVDQTDLMGAILLAYEDDAKIAEVLQKAAEIIRHYPAWAEITKGAKGDVQTLTRFCDSPSVSFEDVMLVVVEAGI